MRETPCFLGYVFKERIDIKPHGGGKFMATKNIAPANKSKPLTKKERKELRKKRKEKHTVK
jgi:hypothetical protein